MKSVLVAAIMALLSFSIQAQNVPSFSVRKSGNGKQAVILIPGYSCSGRVWNETLKNISAKNTCYVITFAGFAGQKPQANPEYKQWEDDLAAYIKKNKIEKPVIIGHSLGGVMAYMLAADYPELVSKFIIVDALPCLSAMFNPAFVSQEQNDCSGIVSKFKSMDDKGFLSMQKQSIPSLMSDTTMRDTVINWGLISDRNTLGLIYCQFINTDVRAKLANIKCPSLVLLESNFKNYNDAIQKQFAGLKNTSLKYADKGLHFIMYDDKDWYLAQVNEFLK